MFEEQKDIVIEFWKSHLGEDDPLNPPNPLGDMIQMTIDVLSKLPKGDDDGLAVNPYEFKQDGHKLSNLLYELFKEGAVAQQVLEKGKLSDLGIDLHMCSEECSCLTNELVGLKSINESHRKLNGRLRVENDKLLDGISKQIECAHQKVADCHYIVGESDVKQITDNLIELINERN